MPQLATNADSVRHETSLAATFAILINTALLGCPVGRLANRKAYENTGADKASAAP